MYFVFVLDISSVKKGGKLSASEISGVEEGKGDGDCGVEVY